MVQSWPTVARRPEDSMVRPTTWLTQPRCRYPSTRASRSRYGARLMATGGCSAAIGWATPASGLTPEHLHQGLAHLTEPAFDPAVDGAELRLHQGIPGSDPVVAHDGQGPGPLEEALPRLLVGLHLGEIIGVDPDADLPRPRNLVQEVADRPDGQLVILLLHPPDHLFGHSQSQLDHILLMEAEEVLQQADQLLGQPLQPVHNGLGLLEPFLPATPEPLLVPRLLRLPAGCLQPLGGPALHLFHQLHRPRPGPLHQAARLGLGHL